MHDARDEAFMRRALALAERGWGRTAPNPMVGAVVVSGNDIVGEGWHAEFGGPHAEVSALGAAGARARGATLYVTLEPCNHWGKTPPCTTAVREAGIARVVAATRDPGAESGGGADSLRGAGIETDLGLLEQEARELNAPFFHAVASDRPWVTLKLAQSVDGAIAGAGRERAWLTGEAARAEVHRMRAAADAIAVGAGTFITDSPSLTVRGTIQPRVSPRRIVFDADGRAERIRTLVQDDGPPWEFVHQRDLALALRGLRATGVRSLLVEGGAGLASALFDAGLVDRLVIFQAPIVLGAGALHPFGDVRGFRVAEAPRYHVVRREAFGDDTMIIYALRAV